MKKIISVIMTMMLIVSLLLILTACGGTQPKQSGAEEGATEEKAAAEQGIELMGISKYSRTELGMHMEFDVSNHQVNENGQVTHFDLHRTAREKVKADGALLEIVDTDESTITLEYNEKGDIISARTDIPGYGFTMHEMTYADGLIDTDAYNTDWSTVEKPYKLQYTYEENDGNVTKITSTNPDGVFLVCEFEYTSLGPVGKADTGKSGFRKWQEFSIIEEALKNCY